MASDKSDKFSDAAAQPPPLPRSFLHRRSVLAITRRFRGFNVIPPRLICAKKARCIQRGLFATKMFRLRRSLPIALANMTPKISTQ